MCGEVDKVAGRVVWVVFPVVWLLGWVVFPVVWLAVDGLGLVVWAGGVMVGGSEPGAVLGPIVASVTGAAVCELLGVTRVVTGVWVLGLVDGVLFVVIREVVVRVFIVVCVVGVSELEVVAAV